jgi:hypothetical protein
MRTSAPLPLALSTVGLCLLGGCGAGDPRTSSSGERAEARGELIAEPADEAGSDRASREAAGGRAASSSGAVDDAPVALEASRPRLTLVRLADAVAEDGHGEASLRPRAIAFDLDARLVPARALDPVLRVGELTLHHYSHPRVGTLRFVLDEEALPPEGAAVWAHYGDDERTRVPLGALERAHVTEAP